MYSYISMNQIVKKQILINGYNLRGYPVGIANVVINFINQISKCDEFEIEVVVFPDIPDCITSRIDKSNNLKITKIGCLNPFIWLFYYFNKYVNQKRPSLLWSPTPILPLLIDRKIKKIVTIHDFVSTDFRDTMTLKGRLVTTLVEKKTIKTANLIWTVSNYTKQRLLELYPEINSKTIVVGSAPDSYFKKIAFEEKNYFLKKNGIDKDFILFVGSLEPRKNLKFLLEVFKQLHCDISYQLVVVGARKWGTTDIKYIVEQDGFPREDVIFLNFISEEELRFLYNIASCYVSTSLNEGFGLPQSEAMKCECPVVTAHNSAMVEVVGGAGITVEGWDKTAWTDAIKLAIANKEEIVKKQNKKIEKYSWDEVSKDIINAIKEI